MRAMSTDEQTLEIALRIDHLRKVRLSSLVYGLFCASGLIAWLWVMWPRSFGPIHTQVQAFGSGALGWVFILGGAALLAGGALVYGRRFASASREIAACRRR